MISLLVYTVAAFGLAYGVGHSRISLPVRLAWADTGKLPMLLELVECPACFGFWIGLFTAGAIHFFGADAALSVPLAALPFYTLGANFILGRWTGLVANPQEE